MTASAAALALALTLSLAGTSAWPADATGAGARPPSPAPVELAATARRADWSEDLDVARDQFLARDLSYSPEARAQAAWRLEQLRSRIDALDDVEIAAELARIAALSANAHTRAYLLRNRGHWRRLPLRLWHFDDGWFVVAARGAAEPLLGGRVTHVAGQPVDEVFATLRPLFAGNDSWATYMGTYTLTSTDALHAAGLADGASPVEYRVEQAGRTLSANIAPEAFVRRQGAEESWWYLSPARDVGSPWRHALATSALPESLRGAASDYRFLRCAGDVVYVQFNRAADSERGETVVDWSDRLLRELALKPAQRLVLDLRFNTGGDLTKASRLVDALAASPLGQEAGRLVVLSGENTFSAGLTPIAVLRGTSRATVVGRPPGDGIDFWAEGGNVVLPHSGLVLHYADGLHSYSGRARAAGRAEYVALGLSVRDLAPDRRVAWTWRDYAAGRDVDIEAALGAPLRCDESATH